MSLVSGGERGQCWEWLPQMLLWVGGIDAMHTFMMLSLVFLFLLFLVVIVVADEILELVFHFLEEGHDYSGVGAGSNR